MTTLVGPDLSSYQAGINMAQVPSDFGIVKATGGTGYVNPACDAQVQSIRAAGKRLGIYHFAHEGWCRGTAAQEAAWFLANVRGYLKGDVLIALDFEADNMLDVAWALEWLNIVFQATGVRPLIYLNSVALNGADWSPVWGANYGLWLAWYAVTTPTYGYNDYTGQPACNANPPLQWGPYSPAMWQYTSTAQLPGWASNLDASVFYGDGATWDAYCRPVIQGTLVADSATPTPTQEDDMLTPEQAQQLAYISSPQFKADIFTGATDLERNARAQHHLELLHTQVPWFGYDGQVQPAGGRQGIDMAAAIGWSDAIATSQAQLTNAVLAAVKAVTPASAPAIVDVKALAAELAPLLTTQQAHQFIVALGAALPKE